MPAHASKDRHLRVSTVIPCYNAESFLQETLVSVFEQDLVPDEVIVIDDGSTDSSAAIAEQFGAPVRVIRQKNQGESVARNRGLDEARGDLVAFLDADDIWKPEKIRQQVQCFQDDHQLVCVHTPYFNFGNSSTVCRSRTPSHERYTIAHVASHPFLIPSAAMVRRSVSARFPTWTQYGEDLLFFLDLLQEGRFCQLDKPLTGHRVHRDAQSASSTVEIEWHRSVSRWLQQSPYGTDTALRETVEASWGRRLTRAATRALLAGKVTAYLKYRDYLRSHQMSRFPVADYTSRLLGRYARRCVAGLTHRFVGKRGAIT